MINFYNPYVRLQTYYHWFSNNEDSELWVDEEYNKGVSISRLFEITQIPRKRLREDIICFFKWQKLLEFDDEHPEYKKADELYHLGHLYDLYIDTEGTKLPKQLETLFIKGSLDNVPLFLTEPYTDYQIPLSPEEAEALHSFTYGESPLLYQYMDLSNKYKYKGNYRIKDSYRFNHHYIELNLGLDKINEAINKGNCLQMQYRTSTGKIISFHFRPLKIAYDSVENLYYVISSNRNKVCAYRFDRILSLESSDKSMEKPNVDLSSISPNVWGCSFEDTPQHVKIRFYNEANVWDKVRKDLSCRSNGMLEEKKEGDHVYLYYEDTVYGISKLKSWILGYGSSAVVLEPASLRQEIIDSLKARLASINNHDA